MRYRSQAVAYPYFAVALLLFGLQVAFGLLAAVKYLGPDPLINLLPFDRVKAIHTNLLLVWVLTGFMGAAYYVVPEESGTELWSPRLAYIALGSGCSCVLTAGDRLTCSAGPRATSSSEQPSRSSSLRRGDADVTSQSPAHDPAGGRWTTTEAVLVAG